MDRQESKKAQAKAVKADPLTDNERKLIEILRPRRRGECLNGPRPCPWFSCQFHLGLDVSADGRIVLHMDPENLNGATCALDVADTGEHTLDVVGALIGWTRERARQVEEQALARLRHPTRQNVVAEARAARPEPKEDRWDSTDPVGID